ncbi:gp58-like family protein [Streptococcus phocae subsp. salmonis]|uniref:gp58-like family protein n=1 Tax=Streptococcus phocae TaxID=119224 RepID=UPI000531ABCD|nr:gp58-like family protein [Streptococcus phocae]KGR72906.1 phage hyaluronidase [Streptococcus phocae subsp. salmonis]QBX27864.1 hyaluronidase [Streptococcus phage Javan420]
MSRDPTTTINEENVTILPDGRFFYTFTPRQNTNSVRLASDCLGNAKFNQIMIEKGDKATEYVAPFVIEGSGESTGIFKGLEEALNSIKEINLEMTDTENSNLWSKIKINNRGMLRTYFDTTIKNEILETARGIKETISDTERGLKSEFTKTVQGQQVKLESLLEQKTAEIGVTVNGLRLSLNQANEKTAVIQASVAGLRQDYKDADRQLSASFQTGIEGLKATIRDEKLGLQAEIASSARGLSQKYDDELRKLSAKITTTSDGTTEAYENKLDGLRAEFTRSNQGIRTELESKISGLQSTQQATANQISQEIKNREGAISRIQQDIDSYQRKLQDATGNYNSLRETVSGFERKISNQNETIQSNYTQLKGLIQASVSQEKLESLLRLSGDSIMLAIKDKLPKTKMSASEIVSAINLNGYGVRLAGERIALDGNTTVNGTFTTKIAEAIKIRADQIIAGTIDAAKIRVINLNASSIVGLDASFIKAKIEHTITSLLEGKVIRARNGAMLIDLNNSKIGFNTNAEIAFNSTSNILYRQKMTNSRRYGNSNNIGALMFKDGYEGGVQVTLGVVSGKTIEQVKSGAVDWNDDGGYAGLRIRRVAAYSDVDGVEVIGDRVIFRHTTKTHVAGTLYWQNTGWMGNWNLGRILQVISNKFRDHGWGAIGDIYNLEAKQDIKPNEYFL